MEEGLNRTRLSHEQTREIMRQLATERTRRGLTQSEVARQMGTSQPYVARLEAGANEPKLSTFLLYAGIVAGAVLLSRLLRDLGRVPTR
jgi:transcriptional regulator with XRE-family HTH domain